MNDWQYLYTKAKEWVLEAGEKVKNSLGSELTIETKLNPKDLVTNVDKEIEAFLYDKIKTQFTDHRIIGEESKGHDITDVSGVIWIIDPIDGTMNFVNQRRNFGISLGIYENGVGKVGITYDVIHHELFHCLSGSGFYLNDQKFGQLPPFKIEEALIAVNSGLMMENRHMDYKIMHRLVRNARGARQIGTATIQLAYVAAGLLDVYFTTKLSAWDVAAGRIFLNEVGGKITNLYGEEFKVLDTNSLMAAKPGFRELFLSDYLKRK